MKKIIYGVFSLLLISEMLSGQVFAGGLILYEMGTPDMGLASAGAGARAQDAGTIAWNPAGMTRIEGSEFLLGAQMLYGDAAFSQDENTTVSGGDGGNIMGWFPMASAFYVNEFNSDLKFGLGFFGDFGLDYEYDASWAGRYFTTEGGFIGISIMPAISYLFNKQVSVGAALNVKYGDFETESAVNTLLPGDGRLEFEDSSWGVGANIGVLYEVSEDTRFGLTYTSPLSLDFNDSLDISGIAIIGNLSRDLEVEFDRPQTLKASFFHQVDEKWALLGSLGWEDWSQFGKIGLQVGTNPPLSYEVDRNYKDTWHGALGTQYQISDLWRLSFGVAYDSSMVDDEDRTPDLPVGEMWRFGFGAEYEWSETLFVGFGYTLVWEGDLDMDQEKRNIRGETDRLSGTYENVNLHFFGINFRWL